MLGYINTIDKSLYQKIFLEKKNLPKPFFTKSNWWEFILIIVISVFVAPIYKSKGRVLLLETYDKYMDLVFLMIGLVCCIALPILWVVQIKPLLIRKLGYYCVGNFEVKKKIELLKLICTIQLPGKFQWVFVSRPLFDSIKLGDIVEVKRSCLGGLEGIQKVRFSQQRVKKLIKKD
jgi:hypothetical protein